MRHLEKTLLVIGLILVTIYAGVKLYGEISSRNALRKFEAERTVVRESAKASVKAQTGKEVDFSLWSDLRIKDYLSSLEGKTEAPLAVLRIPRLHIEVPVFDGTDDLTLNRGAGRIIGTARLGQVGNIGIAGHRDGFFRGLKDIQNGDTMELELPDRTEHYAVSKITITNPDDVSVLRPTETASLTLVTCYPFYFVGSAPDRYIVRASISQKNPIVSKLN